ncbi:MAG: hypothetical protein AAGA54_31930 [Myxococcota bacterium]
MKCVLFGGTGQVGSAVARAMVKPGTITGNAHTPRWVAPLMSLAPDSLGWGTIHVDELGAAFVGHRATGLASQREPIVFYGNKEMKQLSEFKRTRAPRRR